MEIRYALVKELPEMDYDRAVECTTELLAEEGFGVLTEIDVKATLKKKLHRHRWFQVLFCTLE